MDSLLFIKFFMFKSMESAGELIDKVAAAVGLRREPGRQDISGMAVNPDAERCGVFRLVASCKEATDETRQDIPAATLGHAGVAGRVHKAFSAGAEDTGVVALHHDMTAGLCAELPGEYLPLAVVLAGKELSELSLVRREDGPRRDEFMPLGHDGEDIEGVGIKDRRDTPLTGFAKEIHHSIHSTGRPAEPRSDGQCTVAIQLLRNRAEVTARVLGEHGGRVRGRCREKGPRGGVEHHQTATGAEGCSCREESRSGHSLTACDDKKAAVVVLM